MARKSRRRRRIVRSGFDELAAAEVFLQVVRTRGFTAAAKTLGKSVSALSRTVAELEAQLGAQLLVRTTRRMHLTEAGALYATHAESMLAGRRAAREAVRELTGGTPRGHLRVSMPVSVGERLLGPAIPELRRRYPELRLEIDLSDRNVPLVQGGFDLAIRVGRQDDSSLRAQLLARMPVQLVASKTYVAKHGMPRTPAALRDHACITVGATAGPVDWTFFKEHRRETIAIDGVVHTTSPPLAVQLAAAGQGIVRALEWFVRGEKHLVELMPGWSCNAPIDGGVPVFVLYAQTADEQPPLKSRVFVELAKEIVSRDLFG